MNWRTAPWLQRLTALMLLVLGVFPTANLITSGQPLAWYPGAARTWLVWGIVVIALALAIAALVPAWVERAVAAVSRALLQPSPRAFGTAAFSVCVLLCLFFGWRLFALQPIVGDEFAQRFQAHLLASGHLYAVPDSSREFFSTIETLDMNGKWFAQFPMGGPFLLAIGELVHAPWLVNPLLAGVSAVALFVFARAITDELTARGTTLLFVLSPFVLFMGGSQMNHVPALAFTLIALAALTKWNAATTARSAFAPAAVLGLSIGMAATIRPFDAAIAAVAIGVFQLYTLFTRRTLAASLAAQVVAALLPIGLLLLVNKVTLGSATQFAYDVLNGVQHRPGFHMTPQGFAHTPRRGIFNISTYLLKLDVALMAWPVPAMLVVAVSLLLLRTESKWDRLMAGSIWLLLAGYTTYWSLSTYLGPRFLVPLAPFFLYYTAKLPAALRAVLPKRATPQLAAYLLIPLWLAIAWVVPPRDTGTVVCDRWSRSIACSRPAPPFARR